MREWGDGDDEEAGEAVPCRAARARGAHGARACERARLGVGGDAINRGEGGLCTPETLRLWVRQAERDRGERAGLSADERARLKALEREVRELRQANEIVRKASAYFAAAELDRRSKR